MFVVEASEKIGFFSFCVVHERRRIGPAVWLDGNATTPFLELHSPPDLAAVGRPGNLRQPRHVDGDPSRLVLRQHLCLPRLGLITREWTWASAYPFGSRSTIRQACCRRAKAAGRDRVILDECYLEAACAPVILRSLATSANRCDGFPAATRRFPLCS
jgi:hypothetical protein